MKLSICVITMNRAEQLKKALSSCLMCKLPQDTEFVVIDNASADHTERVVREALGPCGCSYYYEKLAQNLGVGGGRNYAYEKACGDYAYMLDDDAVIDCEKDPLFFVKAVGIMDQNPQFVTLTTQIYDTAWEKNRVGASGPMIAEGLFKCKMFCGGSHFLRRSFYKEPPYLPNKYGYEEIPPSLRAINAGKLNVFCSELLVIHNPAVNKWNFNDEKNHALLIKEISLSYAIKSMMYPKVMLPVLKLATKRRIKKYMQNIKDADVQVRDSVRAFCSEYPIKEKISVATVWRMFKDFGISVF